MEAMHAIESAARQFALAAALGLGLAAGLAVTGCGTPAAPQPPSLNLPDPVSDLAAVRAGSQVSLAWTMPKKNTDKLLLKGNVTVRVCREEGAEKEAGNCAPAGASFALAPGAEGTFTDSLPAALAAGPPRLLSYFVELSNRNGRSAGLSNAAQVLAGQAPAPVVGLRAEIRKRGVVLSWTPVASGESGSTLIRLHRRLLTPPEAKPRQGLMTPGPEPLEQNLLVSSCAEDERKDVCRALDEDIRFGQAYEYRAQRVARVRVGKQTLELDGALSAPVRVEALDIFPPGEPTGLAAVSTLGENGAGPAIDLSWRPVSDADLAGYAVYRREGEAAWQRISSAEPLVPPAFHDTHVQPGHTYRYAVSAIARNGHESALSAEAEESVPSP
jgi:hypothetical protein